MSNLAARLRQLQALDVQPIPLPEMSMEELSQMVVDFGHTHKGKTFEYLWEHKQMWMTDHYSASPKESHRRLMRYVEKKIQEAEKSQQSIPLTSRGNTATTGTGSATLAGYPKSLAKPKARPPKVTHRAENDIPLYNRRRKRSRTGRISK